MFKAKLINSDASLNDFKIVGSLEFVPGESLDIAFQLYHSQKDIRHIPPVAATITLTLIDSDGEDIVKSATIIDADDRSMWKIELTPVETQTLAGQNIEGKLDYLGDGTKIYLFVMQNVLQRVNLAGDC